jgi:hypothetical protein
LAESLFIFHAIDPATSGTDAAVLEPGNGGLSPLLQFPALIQTLVCWRGHGLPQKGMVLLFFAFLSAQHSELHTLFDTIKAHGSRVKGLSPEPDTV